MWANADLRGRSAAHRLRATAALLALSATAATGQTLLDAALSGATQFAQLSAGEQRVVSTFDVAAIAGVAGQEIPIQVNLPQASELIAAGGRQVFILVRNMPAGVRLTTGMENGRLWVLSLKDVDGLHLVAPRGMVGSFTLEFNLIGGGNKRLAQQTVPVDLVSPKIVGRIPTTGALAAIEGPVNQERAPRAVRPVERLPSREEAVLLERGKELMRQGGIAAARIIFEELAQKGSAQGALELARSYDPASIPNSRVSAVAPDVEKALMWYRRAEELGSEEARARLATIAPAR
jgi:hypothetical protein